MLTADYEAASPRLSVSGAGRLELTDRLNAEMSMRFQDTSLDPYLRFFEPRLSEKGNVSCGTCHVPERNWTDNMHRGVGNARNQQVAT